MTTERKSRGILMSGPMVSAILCGQKSQTRRIAKFGYDDGDIPSMIVEPYPGRWIAWWTPETDVTAVTEFTRRQYDPGDCIRCPYGEVGDELWVRESLIRRETVNNQDGEIAYGADSHFVRRGPGYIDTGYRSDGSRYVRGGPWTWKRPRVNSIHMPRWASRITLQITEVRVERLQGISTADAIAEGIDSDGGDDEHRNRSSVENYRVLWESINGAGSWDANPFVWCISFRRIGVPS